VRDPELDVRLDVGVSPLDAFMSVKMGTFRAFQLYVVLQI
jgi:hypothetical protein